MRHTVNFFAPFLFHSSNKECTIPVSHYSRGRVRTVICYRANLSFFIHHSFEFFRIKIRVSMAVYLEQGQSFINIFWLVQVDEKVKVVGWLLKQRWNQRLIDRDSSWFRRHDAIFRGRWIWLSISTESDDYPPRGLYNDLQDFFFEHHLGTGHTSVGLKGVNI